MNLGASAGNRDPWRLSNQELHAEEGGDGRPREAVGSPALRHCSCERLV